MLIAFGAFCLLQFLSSKTFENGLYFVLRIFDNFIPKWKRSKEKQTSHIRIGNHFARDLAAGAPASHRVKHISLSRSTSPSLPSNPEVCRRNWPNVGSQAIDAAKATGTMLRSQLFASDLKLHTTRMQAVQ